MDGCNDKILIDAVLERAADTLGDITTRVYDVYYGRYPEARAQFHFHDATNPARLEGTMVEQAVYCLMYWHESPGEIEIVLTTTLPHHIETLGVSEETFAALLKAVCDVVAETIPDTAEAEQAAWRRLEATLLEVIAIGASHARPDLVRQPV